MNDAEERVRELLALATEDIPPGIDLLRGLRARRARAHARASAAAAGALAAVLAAVLAGTSAVRLPAGTPPSTGRAPSALAAVIEAANRTAATSYQVSATYSFWVTPPNTISPAQMTATGMFDPTHGVAEVSGPYFPSIRWVAGYVYLRIGYDGKPWVRFPESALHVTPGQPGLSVGPLAVAQENPQSLLAQLKSASQVRTVGPASGPGWTGTRYGFKSRSAFGYEAEISIAGTVDVDQQGRVRRLDATEVLGYPGQDQMEFRTGIRLAFGGFGAPVSVTAPPASETYINNTGEIVGLK
jgi:hypothetical protein